MSSAVTNISYAQNFTFLESPSEIQTKIICDTDESDWSNLYETCKAIKAVMDQSKPLLLEVKSEQRELLDANIRMQIKMTFSPPYSAFASVPSADTVNSVLIPFQKCRSPEVKMKAFLEVIWANNSTDEIARQFYQALPEGRIGKLDASRTSLRHHIWIANGRSDDGLGLGFGDHIIATAPCGHLAIRGAQELCSELYTKKSEYIFNEWLDPESN